MKKYSSFKPTQFDSHYYVENREDWFIAPLTHNRDSDILTESNWDVFFKLMGKENEDTFEIHRFGHWGPGWFEIILINPANKALVKIGEDTESSLADYPILDEMDFSERENEEAGRIWADCYDTKGRIEYIREHRSQFDFRNMADLVGCVRGNYFAGYASELIG